MTNGLTDETHIPKEENSSIFNQPEGVDWFLAWIVGLAEETGYASGISLTVSGMIISGQLISGRTYFEELRKQMKSADYVGEDGEQTRETVASAFGRWADIYPVPGPENVKELMSPRRHLHMRVLKVIAPNGSELKFNGILWRGKLSAVDGYCVGNLSG